MKNSFIIVAVAFIALVVGAAVYLMGGHKQITASTAAVTANDAKIAEFNFAPTTAAATTTSVLNSDSQDRIITSFDTACSGLGTSLTAYTGAGLAALVFKVATSSTDTPNNLSNTNYVYNGTIATSSSSFYDASSTPGLTSATVVNFNRRWPAGTYLTVSSNATNTASCILNARYLQSFGI